VIDRMSVNYITLGYDCSPAVALRNLNLRNHALPFDWIVSTISTLDMCFKTNFENFHTNLSLNTSKKRLIDMYGFEFPHDYPLRDMSGNDMPIGEGQFGESDSNCICDSWMDYYSLVMEKYSRRIERFRNCMKDTTKPLVVLCRYDTHSLLQLPELLEKYYNRRDVYFLNSYIEPFENNTILNINTEKNNIWNESALWEKGLDRLLQKIKY
jgi:hypothetical protein